MSAVGAAFIALFVAFGQLVPEPLAPGQYEVTDDKGKVVGYVDTTYNQAEMDKFCDPGSVVEYPLCFNTADDADGQPEDGDDA